MLPFPVYTQSRKSNTKDKQTKKSEFLFLSSQIHQASESLKVEPTSPVPSQCLIGSSYLQDQTKVITKKNHQYIIPLYTSPWVSQVAQWSTCQFRRHRRRGFDPWVKKIPWRKAWQLTPVFLPGESNGQRSLKGYSPQDCKESDMMEVT